MRLVIALVLFLATIGTSLPAQAPSSDPLATYKQYLTVLAKAKTLDELLPYYTKELAEGLRKMPAEMRGNYLKLNARTLTELKVTKQSITADKAMFEMTAKTAAGDATTGSATLVKEGGAWKIDDDAWVAPAQ